MKRRVRLGGLSIMLMCWTALAAEASTTSPVLVKTPPLTTIPQSAYLDINGANGGTLTVGRFTIRVARGAYSGVSRFTIFVPDPAVLQCNVTMNPVVATFKTKPTLEANYSGVTGYTARSFWWINSNPSTGAWAVSSNTTVNTTLTKVIESLAVFSQHGVAASKTVW